MVVREYHNSRIQTQCFLHRNRTMRKPFLLAAVLLAVPGCLVAGFMMLCEIATDPFGRELALRSGPSHGPDGKTELNLSDELVWRRHAAPA